MKKITLSIALVFCMFAAQSQIFVSLNAGGSMSSGNTNVTTKISVATDSTYVTDTPHDNTLSLQGGFRFGYKSDRIMFGLGANYAITSVTVHTLNPSVIPIAPTALWYTEGEMTTQTSVITIAPFFRYDIIKAGDIALFAELNAFYAMEQDPTVSAHQTYIKDGALLREFDTTFSMSRSGTGYGARVTPGLSWLIDPHVSLDLYLDFLSLAYASYTRTSVDYTYDMSANAWSTGLGSTVTTTTTTTQTITDIDLGIFGSPHWGSDNPSNFVRVGLNICF